MTRAGTQYDDFVGSENLIVKVTMKDTTPIEVTHIDDYEEYVETFPIIFEHASCESMITPPSIERNQIEYFINPYSSSKVAEETQSRTFQDFTISSRCQYTHEVVLVDNASLPLSTAMAKAFELLDPNNFELWTNDAESLADTQ